MDVLNRIASFSVSLISVRIAEIVMQFLEFERMSLLDPKICFLKRYVDDVFLVARYEDLSEILEVANSICAAIQFTFEIASDRKLHFLNIKL